MSAPQATVLALQSLGLVLARSWALTAVTVFLAVWRRRQEQTVRPQLRELCDEAEAKRGPPRQALAVDPCFVPLRRWVLSGGQGTQRALALEATTWGLRCTVLAIRVVQRGGASPVAWTILPATQPAAWRHHWLRLRRPRRPALPLGYTVMVLADRGLQAPGLCRRIVRLGWHPFLRINIGGTFRPAPQATYRPLLSFVPQPGTCWRGPGTAFKSRPRRRRCTLLACWEAGDTDPWLILTDGPPEASAARWYGLRAWIEPQFTCSKRAGWPWQRTRMTQPDRAARLGLAVAVATLGLLSVGGAAEETIPASTRLDVTAAVSHQRRQRRATRRRLVSIFRRGWMIILVGRLKQAPLPLGVFLPALWPPLPALDASRVVPNPEVYPHVAA